MEVIFSIMFWNCLHLLSYLRGLFSCLPFRYNLVKHCSCNSEEPRNVVTRELLGSDSPYRITNLIPCTRYEFNLTAIYTNVDDRTMWNSEPYYDVIETLEAGK